MTATATMKTHPNGTPASNAGFARKNLSGQLDRLDLILDGLDEALQGAITDAVKQAVSIAVGAAVRATVFEIVTNPDVISALRNGVLGQSVPTSAQAVTANGPRLTIRQRIALAGRWSQRKFNAAGRMLIAPVRKTIHGTVTAVRQINQVWRLRRPLLIAAGIGLAVGAVVGCTAVPWLAGVISGIGAMGTALGAQLTLWTRRLFGGFAMN